MDKTEQKGYSRGYEAGKRRGKKDRDALLSEINRLNTAQDTKDERVFMKSFEIALAHCRNWEVGGKKMSDMKSYCKLARVMADNAIKVIR